MSLHLRYRLTLPGAMSFDEVRETLGSLKRFAETMGFDEVLGPTEYTIDELVNLEDNDVVKMIATALSADPPDFFGTPCGGACVVGAPLRHAAREGLARLQPATRTYGRRRLSPVARAAAG